MLVTLRLDIDVIMTVFHDRHFGEILYYVLTFFGLCIKHKQFLANIFKITIMPFYILYSFLKD